MIKLQNLVIDESISPVKIDNETDLKTIDELIKYCHEMGENSQIIWRGIRVGQNYPIYHIIHDRDWFRGANIGARTIMKKLGIKTPTFGYIGNMQALTKLFGRTFAIVLKQPYNIFQSTVVDDVMAWAQPVIYKQTDGKGYTHRQSVGTRTEKEQIEKALEGAKTYKKLSGIKNIDDSRNEIIIDTNEYWVIDVGQIYSQAGKFVRQYHKEKQSVSFGRVTHLEDYFETYGEIIDILTHYRKFTAWKFKKSKTQPAIPV